MRFATRAFALLALSARAGAAAPASFEVAVTFDDLPAHGDLPAGMTRARVLADLVAALAAHRVPATGFVTAANGADDPSLRAALRSWVAAGNAVGNHTASHLDLARVSAEVFLADVDRDEAVLRDVSPAGVDPRTWKVFRYPYLEEGTDAATRAAVRDGLRRRGYVVAPVTVDFADWAYNAPYARCLSRGDAAAVESLRRDQARDAVAALRRADALARRLLGRPVRHVLLLHVGAFTAATLDGLLAEYARAGVRFVPLAAALEDPAHRLEPSVVRTRDETLLEQLARERGLADVPPAPRPLARLDALCR